MKVFAREHAGVIFDRWQASPRAARVAAVSLIGSLTCAVFGACQRALSDPASCVQRSMGEPSLAACVVSVGSMSLATFCVKNLFDEAMRRLVAQETPPDPDSIRPSLSVLGLVASLTVLESMTTRGWCAPPLTMEWYPGQPVMLYDWGAGILGLDAYRAFRRMQGAG